MPSFAPSFELPRSLDIAAVTALATELVRVLALGDLALDASAVVRVDAAGLQLLCALAITARRNGTRIDWQGVPAVLENGARTLALTDALGWARPGAPEPR